MAGMDDLFTKAKDAANSKQVRDALKSEQAEDISDKGLDGASGLANKITGDKFAERIEGFRDSADKKIGND